MIIMGNDDLKWKINHAHDRHSTELICDHKLNMRGSYIDLLSKRVIGNGNTLYFRVINLNRNKIFYFQ